MTEEEKKKLETDEDEIETQNILDENLSDDNSGDDVGGTDTETNVVEEEEGATPTPNETEEEVEEEEVVEQEKMLPQSKVNELIGQARREGREAAMKEYMSQMFGKYGVSDETELDDIFGRGQAYESLNEDYNLQSNSLRDVMAENALLKSKVRSDKFEDIKLILGGKGLEITVENIEALLPTHPEWMNTGNSSGDGVGLTGGEVPPGIVPIQEKPTTLKKLGSEVSVEPENVENEFDKAKKLFGI